MTRFMLIASAGVALAIHSQAHAVNAPRADLPAPASSGLGAAMSESEIRAVQNELLARGYPTLATGEMGHRTSIAIASFQKDHGLPVTGLPDEATRRALGLAGAMPASERHARQAGAPQRPPPQRRGDRQRIEDREDMSPGWSKQNPAVGGQADAQGASSSKAASPLALDEGTARTAEHARVALDSIRSADAALRGGDTQRAQWLLDRAAQELRVLYGSGPGADVLRRIDVLQQRLGAEPNPRGAGEPQQQARTGGGAPSREARPEQRELAPLFAELRRQLAYADPAALAAADEAQRRAASGDRAGASDQLQLARSRVVADAAFLPVEDAYARVLAARAELRDGDPHAASRLLRGTPIVLQEVIVTAPLVPVRFDLRAAAVAAEQGDWIQATELVGHASQQIERIQKSASGDAAGQLDRLAEDAAQLQSKIAEGQRVAPGDIRKLAQRTRDIETG